MVVVLLVLFLPDGMISMFARVKALAHGRKS
jgi:hypothetical protein